MSSSAASSSSSASSSTGDSKVDETPARFADTRGHREGKYGEALDRKKFDLSDDDYKLITGLSEEQKVELKAIFETIRDINGAQDDVVAGQPKSYIDSKAFFQWIEPVAAHNGNILNANQVEVFEQVLNYIALGGGKMGFLGSVVRKALRPFFSKDREAKRNVVTGLGIPEDIKSNLARFKQDSERYKHLGALFAENARSIAAQAGVNLYTKLHHWDIKQQREWKALFQALVVADEMVDEEVRPLVYLACHPIPLNVINDFRKAAAGKDITTNVKNSIDGKDIVEIPAKGFVNSVSIRAKSTPAGTAAFAVCAVAWSTISAETYASKLKNRIYEDSKCSFDEFWEAYEDVREHGEQYHIMAREFNVIPKTVDQVRFKMWMDVACAYVYEVVKGTLARSAALSKYNDNNKRVVDLWRTRFRLEKESEGDSVTAYVNALDAKTLPPAAKVSLIRAETKVMSAKNEYVGEKLGLMNRAIEAFSKAAELDGGIIARVDELLPESLRNL